MKREFPRVSHKKLVRLATKWLKADHPIVVTEMATSAMEEPDALGIRYDRSTLIECKASRNDFLADSRKRSRVKGGLGTHRYYLAPRGMLDRDELPGGWGLLETDGKRIFTKGWASLRDRDLKGEFSLLMSVVRRIGQNPPRGVSVKVYTIETKNRATLGILPEEDDE